VQIKTPNHYSLTKINQLIKEWRYLGDYYGYPSGALFELTQEGY
jgi:hypothetical protein